MCISCRDHCVAYHQSRHREDRCRSSIIHPVESEDLQRKQRGDPLPRQTAANWRYWYAVMGSAPLALPSPPFIASSLRRERSSSQVSDEPRSVCPGERGSCLTCQQVICGTGTRCGPLPLRLPLMLSGCYDALSAKVMERAGHDTAFVSGCAVSDWQAATFRSDRPAVEGPLWRTRRHDGMDG